MSGLMARITAASRDAVLDVEFDCVSLGSLNVGRNAAGVPSLVNQEFIHSPLMLATRSLGITFILHDLTRIGKRSTKSRPGAYLRQILSASAAYYNQVRTHLVLGKDAPLGRAVQRTSVVVAIPMLS